MLFFQMEGNYNSMRLNFSYSDNNTIKEGIKRLAEVIKDEMAISYEEEPSQHEGV